MNIPSAAITISTTPPTLLKMLRTPKTYLLYVTNIEEGIRDA
jgi:hypothetical protein